MRTAEEILSKHTGTEGIYLEKGQHYGKDVLDAMHEYAEERASELMQGVNQLQKDLSKNFLSSVSLSAYNSMVGRKDLLEKYVEHLAKAIMNDEITEMVEKAAEAYYNALDRT